MFAFFCSCSPSSNIKVKKMGEILFKLHHCNLDSTLTSPLSFLSPSSTFKGVCVLEHTEIVPDTLTSSVQLISSLNSTNDLISTFFYNLNIFIDLRTGKCISFIFFLLWELFVSFYFIINSNWYLTFFLSRRFSC